MLLYWLFLQLIGGFTQVGSGGGVAFWAHVGGFGAGVLGVKLLERPDRIARHQARNWRPERVGW